jgi:DNA-binding NarL/FixJ family response regulator
MIQDAANQPSSGTLVVVDRFGLRRESLVSLLRPWANSAGFDIISLEASDEAPRFKDGPDLIVINLGAETLDCTGLRGWAAQVRLTTPQVPIVVFAESEDPQYVVSLMREGVRGYIPASMPSAVALQALSFILVGGVFFPPAAFLHAPNRAAFRPGGMLNHERLSEKKMTSRQDDVLQRLRLGKPNKVIARELEMRESTVKVHVREIMRKLGVRNRTEAALRSSVVAQDTNLEPRRETVAVDRSCVTDVGRPGALRLVPRTGGP